MMSTADAALRRTNHRFYLLGLLANGEHVRADELAEAGLDPADVERLVAAYRRAKAVHVPLPNPPLLAGLGMVQ